MKHLKLIIRPPGDPNQQIISPGKEEHNRHLDHTKMTRSISHRIDASTISSIICCYEENINKNVRCNKQSLPPCRELVVADWFDVFASE